MSIIRRLAAAVSLVTSALALVGVVVYIAYNPLAALASVFTVSAAMVCGWYAAGHRRRRAGWAAAAVVSLIGTLALLLDTRRDAGLAVTIVIFALTSVASARIALRHGITLERHSIGIAAGPCQHPVLLVNPRSGDGKAQRTGLVDTARQRGITVVELRADDDLEALAEQAVTDGADVLGMAGGDGSQAVVARVAARRGVPLVCIASGTRNHFAADLRVDRSDVIAGLDAFGDAVEYRVDLGLIVDGAGGERVFVNNVGMGVYGSAVQAPEYREAKGSTVMEVLQQYAGPQVFDLRFAGPDGTPHPQPDVLFVGNNPYQLTNLSGFGSRTRLDTGQLGVVSVRIDHPSELAQLAALELSHRPRLFAGWREWTTPDFVVDSGGPIEAGVDGEGVTMAPPVRFTVLPSAVRVRVPRPVHPVRFGRVPSPLRTLARLVGDRHHIMDSRRSATNTAPMTGATPGMCCTGRYRGSSRRRSWIRRANIVISVL